ncbi:hypothetical protein [Methylobacterium sp. MA0201]|uniref:hypothetical protein n=1 Tax=Methylobacterium alsaeris TaxID=3344826 RepID=UPI003756E954
MDAHTQIQDEVIRHLKASLMTPEVADALGVPVKGVLKLVDRPVAAEDTPVVIVEVGHEQCEYDEGETPPDRLVERTLQVVVIVSVNAGLKAFAPVVRGISDRVRVVLAGFRRFGVCLLDAKVLAVSPEDYPSETGRQAGHTLQCAVVFKSRENTPDVIERLRG